MKRIDTISKLKKYFDIRELVSKDVYNALGQNAWKLIDTRLLETLLALREKILCVPMVINNWKAGGNFSQRGFRENTSDIVKQKTNAGRIYLSAHCFGCAVDFHSTKMTPDEIRHKIAESAKLLPHPVRLENGKDAPTWVHIDVAVNDETTAKINWF